MEIILAIVVVCAVIFFGMLISIGNDRQRRQLMNYGNKLNYGLYRT